MTVIDRKRPKFRSGITGALHAPKLETPENKYMISSVEEYLEQQFDKNIKDVWLTAYVEMIKTKQREVARIIADEAVEDYLERFGEEF